MDINYSLGTLASSSAPLSLSESERRRHLYLSGKTGTGKSTVLFNLMLSDIHAGRGFALLDPHGDLAKSVAEAIPANRVNDAIYLDPQDPTHAVGFNPLEHVPERQRSIVAAAIVSAFKSIWRESWGPRMEYIFGNTVRLLLDIPAATLLHIPLVLSQPGYRYHLLKRCTDPFIRYFWQNEFAKYTDRFRAEAIAPIQNRPANSRLTRRSAPSWGRRARLASME